jgi:hypothetical protein
MNLQIVVPRPLHLSRSLPPPRLDLIFRVPTSSHILSTYACTVAFRSLPDNDTTCILYQSTHRAYPSSNISASLIVPPCQADSLACRRGFHGFATTVNILRVWHDMKEHKDNHDARALRGYMRHVYICDTGPDHPSSNFGNHYYCLP